MIARNLTLFHRLTDLYIVLRSTVFQRCLNQYLPTFLRIDDFSVIVVLEPENIDPFPSPSPPLPRVLVGASSIIYGPHPLRSGQIPPNFLDRHHDVLRPQHHGAPSVP